MLRSIITTLQDVYENERVVTKGLENMARYVNEHYGEIKRMFTSTSMLLLVNEHSAQLDRALG
jgi:ferritin-like metal-binding protein YciE